MGSNVISFVFFFFYFHTFVFANLLDCHLPDGILFHVIITCSCVCVSVCFCIAYWRLNWNEDFHYRYPWCQSQYNNIRKLEETGCARSKIIKNELTAADNKVKPWRCRERKKKNEDQNEGKKGKGNGNILFFSSFLSVDQIDSKSNENAKREQIKSENITNASSAEINIMNHETLFHLDTFARWQEVL